MAETKICPACNAENPATMKFCGHCGSRLDVTAAAPPAPTPVGPSKVDEADVHAALKSFVSSQVAERIVEEGGAPAEERRLVTALFADLSGFTPLADRLDPEELLEVIDPVINRLTQVVGRYEGYVDKFAGDALLAFFGAPTAHEDDADRGLLVALEMHEELEKILPELPEGTRDLSLHIGVNTGHVIARVLGTEVRMDYSVLGDAVILAQRLESAAPSGATYVGSVTHYLTRDRFEFEPVGELTLKGKKLPVTAWSLVGRRTSVSRPTSPRFVGRKKELETARLVLDGLSSGSGAVISVSGEPGVGKTRLTREIQREARAGGVRWLTGRCLSYGSAIAYWPFADLFRSLWELDADDPHEAARVRLTSELEKLDSLDAVPYLGRLLGLPGPDPGPLDPETYRRRLHSSIKDVLARIAQETPLVVAIEDLHWGDPSSVGLITELVPLCQTHAIALYLTARIEAVPVLVEIAAQTPDMMRHSFRLERFMQNEIEDLVSGLLEGHAPRDVRAAIAERSAGNPFFAEELVRAMQDAGQLVRTETGWKTSGIDAATLPPTVEGVLSSRIDLLPRRTAAILQDASVIGRRVRIPILKELEGGPPDLDAELQTLIERAYLEPSDRVDEVVFHHALVQEVAYARLLRKQKQQLHRRVADIAESLYGSEGDVIDLLARHLYLGKAGAKAMDYLVRAGERSKGLFANEEAILHFSRAAELARAEKDGRARLDEILLQLGDLHELRGQYEVALTLYAEVRDRSDDARAWAGLASTLRNRGEYAEALQLVDEAIKQGNFSGEEKAQLWHEKGWLLSRQGDFGEAIRAFEQGLTAARADVSPTVARLLLQLGRAESITGQLADALDHVRRAVDALEELEDPRGQARAMRMLGDTYISLGRFDEALVALRRGLELAERTGDAQEIGGCLINLGIVEEQRDNLDSAITWTSQAVEHFDRIGHSTGLSIAYGNLAGLLLKCGKLHEADEKSAKALELASSLGDLETIADVKRTLAKIRYEQRSLPLAAEAANEAAALYDQMGASSLADEARSLAERASQEAVRTT